VYGERIDFERLFSDLILSKKASDVVIKEVLEGLYKMGR
jgi:hypothetical protein